MGVCRLKIRTWNIIICLLIISVFFENMKIISVMGTAFKPTHIVFLLAILTGIAGGYVKKSDMLIGLFSLLLPCFSLYRINNKMEWFKSYVIYVIIICFLIFSFRKFINAFKKNYCRYIKLLLGLIALTQVLGIIQFICMNFFGYFFLRNFFGTFEYQTNIFNMSNGFYRAYSVYHEPSFFGLVTLTAAAIIFCIGKAIYSRKTYIVLLVLDIAAVFVSLSASCLIIFLILVTIQQFIKGKSKLKNILSVFLLVIVLSFLALNTTILSPVMRLFTEINLENSSGYERTTTQIMYVQRTLQYYPILGRGLGQQGAVDAVGQIGLYSAINNALAGIIVNFGLTSLFFYIPLFRQAAIKAKNDKRWIPIIVTIIGIYASTGAYISVDTFNMVVLLCTTGACITLVDNSHIKIKHNEFR